MLHAVLQNIYQVYAGLAESKQIDYRLDSDLEGETCGVMKNTLN